MNIGKGITLNERERIEALRNARRDDPRTTRRILDRVAGKKAARVYLDARKRKAFERTT